MLLEANSGKLSKGTWVCGWIEVGKKREESWMKGCWASKMKSDGLPFYEGKKKKEPRGYLVEVKYQRQFWGVGKNFRGASSQEIGF